MEKGKTGKPAFAAGRYFKYAIGEIILVVIGILIALKVNDLNEKKKFSKQDQLYLNKMQEDLQIISGYMNNSIQQAPEHIKEAQLALYSIQYCESDSVSNPILEKTLATAGNIGTIYVRNATYTEMLANGSFSRMKNDSLKNLISDIYSQLDYLNESISYFRTELGVANKIIWDHVNKEFRLDIDKNALSNNQINVPVENQIMVKFNFEEICKSSKLKNALVEVIDTRKDVYSSSIFVFNNLNATLNMLNSEIQD